MLVILENEYLNTPCREKLCAKVGSTFGSEKGYIILIVRALYVLKSSGAAWRDNLVEPLTSMGYISTDSEPDVWIQRATSENGTAY